MNIIQALSSQPWISPCFDAAAFPVAGSADRCGLCDCAKLCQPPSDRGIPAPSLLSGGPSWIDSETYDIEAKAEDNAIPMSVTGKPLWDETRLMLRALLADRFKLAIHRETKEMSIYELVVAKGGPKLKPSTADCATNLMCHGMSGNPRRMIFTGVDTNDLALILTGYSDRLAVDKTGVTGLYDMLPQWNPFAGRPDQPANDAAPPTAAASKEGNGPMPDAASLPSIFDALQQAGGRSSVAGAEGSGGWVGN
jgi:uncharacterized protein (TIGR03435 family)